MAVRRISHVSRYLSALRKQRGLRPSQLARELGASNPSKVGSLIRAFELGEPISVYWFDKLITALGPKPAELRRCQELDQTEKMEQLELERIAWDAWADEPIDPFLSIRYMPAVYGLREVPRAFCNSREQAEEWAANELKRFHAKGYLHWTRRDRTWYDDYDLNPRRIPVTFEHREAGSWMQLSGGRRRFHLGEKLQICTQQVSAAQIIEWSAD